MERKHTRKAEPAFPRCFDSPNLANDGFPVCSAPYRAPEMAFGDVGFGRAVDMWSLGLVVMDMLGQHAHLQKSDKHPPRYGFLYSAASVFIGQVDVKHFKDHPMPPPPCFSKLRTPVWALIVTETLGDNGVDFVSQLLKMNPSKRLSVEGALAHPFLLWDVSTPKSLVPFEGKRHPWNLVTYDLEPNVLEWLRADPVFHPSKFQKALGVTFAPSSRHVGFGLQHAMVGAHVNLYPMWVCASVTLACGGGLNKNICKYKTFTKPDFPDLCTYLGATFKFHGTYVCYLTYVINNLVVIVFDAFVVVNG